MNNIAEPAKGSKPLIKSMKKNPSQLQKEQTTGKSIIEQFPKPKIIQFLNIGDNSIHIDSQVDVDEPLFAPEPHVIQFTNYEPLQTKEQILKLRNKDRVARSIKIIAPDNKLFTVTPAKKSAMTSSKSKKGASEDIDMLSCKVAPGMEITYIVKFYPEAKSDYAYDLMVITEREKFIVPIRAMGCRAVLDFPDQLDFGLVPVKYNNEKPVILRNIGEKTTKWQIKTPASFQVNKSEGILEVGQVEQLVFSFKAAESRKYKEELTLLYDNFEATIPTLGEAHNDNVYLSKGHVIADPTSITLFSHQYYKIVNKSAVPIEFSWRAFATDAEEREKKDRLNSQLAQEEADELAEIERRFNSGKLSDEDEDASLDSDDSYDNAEMNAKQERRRQKALNALSRKYLAIKKAVTDDSMLFQDEIFQIEPLEGKIWPNTEMTCCVTFRPQGPYQYSCTAYCNTTCSQDRLSLNLSGQGKGPQAQLSISEMDIGDIFVTSQKSFEVGIENTGEIDCHWKLIPYETPFGAKFSFSKSEGTLGVKEHQRDLLKVTFLSDILGEFSETFRFALEGSSEMLTLTFKGHVVAPTFRFSDEIIDFGKVSYKFPVTKTVSLTNTSEVDINYSIRVPGDGRALQQEFKFSNEKGRLAANKTAEIEIQFIPCFATVYDMVLVVDLAGVGQDMLAVPIKAESLVPKVRVTPVDFMEYGTVFLRHKKTMQIEIINEDELKSKFEILPQEEQSKRMSIYEVDIQSGVIEPRQKQIVNVSLRSEILHLVRAELRVRLEGVSIPVLINLTAESIGPIVAVDRQDIDYGNVEVLRDYTEKIRISNKSKIDAEYTAFTKNKESIWKVVQRHGILKPDEEKVVDVVCNADEVQKFQDKLHIIINNGVDLEVNLTAKGTGSTLYCKQDLRNIDFGTEYTHKVIPKQFFLENRGRKQMRITWIRQVKPQKKDAKEKAEAVANKKANQTSTSGLAVTEKKEEEDEMKFVFTVIPDTVVLNPKMGIMIEFRANSSQTGKMIEPWQCQAVIGNDRKPKPVFNSTVFGNFITPILTFNIPKLDFKYLWEKGVPSAPITKELVIKNMGPLATTINLKIDPPFSCPIEKLTLEKDKSDSIKIDFDPGMKQDRLSDHINGKLTISHDGHPHKDIVALQGEVCFPNLQILPPKIDFGCILNDTSKKKYLTLSNISEMPVAYEWSFLEDAPILDEMDEIEDDKKKKKKSKKNKKLPINEVFDILPVSGMLLPGQTEHVEFTFYAGNAISYGGTAVCSCDGGPDYEVPIQGDSNLVTYRLSTKEIDFGEVAYNESSTRDFFIENIGKVPFEFSINLSTVSRPGLIECSTMQGKVLAGEKLKIVIKFFAGIPDNIREMFLVECSHFPAERFTVKAVGIYPGCLLSFPRAEDDQFSQKYENVKTQLEQKKVDYSALFHGIDALKLMPPIPAKFVDKEKVGIKEKETFGMEVEAECDRQILCQKIITMVDQQVNNNLNMSAMSFVDEKVAPAAEAKKDAKKETGGKLSPADKALNKKALNNTQSSDANATGNGAIKVGGVSINLDNIQICTYVCDFGNVVVGGSKKRSFRLTNVGKIPINFVFDKKLLSQAGIAIDQDKGQKIMPNTSQLFTVVFTSRKTSKYGRTHFLIPIEIKNGPTYMIDFIANLTIPELSMSTDSLDFEKVCINTRKTVKLRIENLKEVPCVWWFHNPSPAAGGKEATPVNGDKKKEIEFFQVWPLNGTLLPGQRSTIDVMFTPNNDKPFTQKLLFKCNENMKQFQLNVKGQGINNVVELVPDTIKLGPVLPYDTKSIECFEIVNPMEHPIEIFSLDFDKQYLEEEDIIKRIENFSANGANEPIFLPFRKAGSEFWPSLRKADEIKIKTDAIKQQIKKIDEQLQGLVIEEQALSDYQVYQSLAEKPAGSTTPPLPEKTQEQISETRNHLTNQKGELDSKLAEIAQENLEVKLPPAIKEVNKVNIVLVGPNTSGRTTLANYMAQEHQRCVIRVDQLLDYWVKRGHSIAEEATKFLEDRHAELTAALAAQEAQKKAKKPKKGEVEIEINQAEYKILPKELLTRMVALRVQEEDCNAGSIFDCLTSENWPDEKFAISFISDAIPIQHIQVVMFNFNKEQLTHGKDNTPVELEVCTNYRYAQRHNPVFANKRQQKKEEEKVSSNEVVERATPRPNAKGKGKSSSPNKGKDKKQPTEETTEETAAAAEVEKARKKAEAEQALKAQAESKKDKYRPKVFTEDEKQKWKAYTGGVSDLIGELQQKQLTSAETDAEKNYGTRTCTEIKVEYNYTFLCEYVCKAVVPEPLWPDPDKEPLPPPVISSILKKPPNRSERAKITKFSIFTPTEEIVGDKLPAMSDTVSRWVLGPKESKKLYIKFFSTKIGSYSENLQFEIIGSYKSFTLPIQGLCEFPQINQNVKNLFMNIKKSRPAEKDALVIKSYIQSENQFEFGPLLIKKDVEKRSDPKVQEVNSTLFQITNNGKYKVEAVFTLRSTLSVEEGGHEGKSPFIIEPTELSLDIDQTLPVRIYAFPDQAQLYTDQVVILIKDNPNPVILPIQCLGAKPGVAVSHDTVQFERALLNKTLTKTLTLTNTCPLKVNWRLKKTENLPAEFTVKPTSGTLLPFKEEGIDITFKSISQKKFLETIVLEVDDVEGLGIKQDDKNIMLDAEAFNITLNEAMQIDQVLDFDAVRVGEPKEQTLFLKNQGQYPIKYDFTIRKKAQEIFSIEPMVGRLLKDEEINIVVKFLSMKEIKLKTNKQNAEIFLNILEGDQNEKHQQIPILVNVNAVYSKYSLAPLKNLNFGPMQYGENVTRSFEIRNEGLFEFKYAICDYNNEDEKTKIREERKKEAEERLHGTKKEEVDPKADAKGKKPDPKAAPPAKPGAKGGKAEIIPDGQVVNVSQYSITPAIGSIAPGSAAVISVTFAAQGSKFYNNTLAIDVANRDPNDQSDGIPFQLAAESSIPGINTTDLDSIFEEQTVIPSLDPSVNTQTIISSSLFSIQENVFWFGTLIASKDPQGTFERFKIMNPNKVTCNVKFSVKPRSMSKSEGFAFKVEPEGLSIDPHKHKYVTVYFSPTEMKQYGGVFEAVVQGGELNPKQGKMSFEIRGEGTLPSLQVMKPDEYEADGTPVLKFRKTRIGKDTYMQIILKNEGQVPATARFDAITNDAYSFEGTSMNHTISSKQNHAFDFKFTPKKAGIEKFVMTFQTQNNPYEQHKVVLLGEGYAESVTFEQLPNGREDLLMIGDCVIGKAKAVNFTLVNTGDKDLKFRWSSGTPEREEFTFYPSIGHLKSGSSKQIKVMVRGKDTKKYENIDFICETQAIQQKGDENSKWNEWDDTMKTVKMVRPSEQRKFMRDKEIAEHKRKEEAEAAAFAAANKKGAKPPAKAPVVFEEVIIDLSEEATVQLIDVIHEPEFDFTDAAPKQQNLKTSCIIDRAGYDCAIKQMDFKPTLMYATRSLKFTVKNTSLVGLEYNFKIVNSQSGILDAGPYTIIPKKGTISPSCDEHFIVKFAPVEVENDFTRILSGNINHLNPNQEPLIIELNGTAQRPIIHFELPLSNYREKKAKDMSFLDEKLKIIEFESLGTNIRNTNRFMAVNPTSQGYEFEWEEIVDESKKKALFKCATPKGLILSGKKTEMVFEYVPDNVGEHDSRWLFKIPSEKITQEFLVVGRVNEPNVLFESGKMKFGPLLLGGKAKETVRIINQEHIPFAFNFTNASVKGSPDYGDSLKVTPMSGLVPAFSDLPIEIVFNPKYELTYNYNLQCNIKRKARPLVLNVKGEGYQIHHTVMADEPQIKVQSNEACKLYFGEFFINEVKTKQVVLTNNGEFNFDFLWKRIANKFVTISPETGTVQKGGTVKITIQYSPTIENELKNYKATLTVLSGPKYDFNFSGSARKPGVRLSQNVFDFGQCFVTSQPAPIKKILTITNIDNQAISVETNFEKKVYLDFPVVPGQVLMPDEVRDQKSDGKNGETVNQAAKIEIPITFTPRELKQYHEIIKLNFNNGLYFIDVVVQGQGIPLNLDLKDPDQAFTNLGVVSVGQEVSKIVPVVNRSMKTVKFHVIPRDKKAFAASTLSQHPEATQEIILKPKESYPVEIRFRPKTRLPPFEHDLMLQIEGIDEPRKFFTVHGVAHGIELKLMDEVAAFGNVVIGSRLTKYIQMSNFGDVKANFSWNKNEFSKNFTINPASGYINPNSNLDLEVTFHPTKDMENENIGSGKVTCEAKVTCEVKGGETIALKMMGKPVSQDGSQLQELNFNTVVRKTTTQNIQIQNTEDKEWAINPTISTKDNSTDYFTGKETLIVPPKSTAAYEVVYMPKTMTKKEKKSETSEELVDQPHLGSLFFPLPNGTALLYNLKGIATAPQSEGLIQETVQARKQKNFIVKVKNWAKKTQRFEASWKVEGPNDSSLFIRGANTFDIAGESYKEYKLNFLALRAGVYKFSVTFKEKITGEYIFYQFAVTVEECKDIEKFELVSSVRESCQHPIVIENPTNEDVKVTKQQFIFTNDYLEITPDDIVIKAHESREFNINFRPLIISETSTDIVLKNPILGEFKYNLALKGVAPTTQRSLAFKCSLGQDQMQTFKFTHFMKKAVTYQIKIERADGPGVCDFKIEGQPTVVAPAADSFKGVDLSVNIKYEPFTIGDSRGVIKLTCAEGLEYNCLLYGRSSAPQPQGPIKCPIGAKPAGIDFKNPLNEKSDFVVTFDNNNFSLASKLPGPLDPGKVTNFQIKYDGKADLPSTGRMIVTSKGLPPWIFYLQGE